MLKLEEITKHAALTGIEPGQVVRVVTTEPVGDNSEAPRGENFSSEDTHDESLMG